MVYSKYHCQRTNIENCPIWTGAPQEIQHFWFSAFAPCISLWFSFKHTLTQIEVIVDRIISNTSWNFTMVYFKLAVTALFALTFSDARLQANVRMIHIDRDRNGGFGEMPCCRGTRCFRQFVNLDTPLHISHLEFFFLSSFSLRPTGRTWGSNYMRPKRILQVPIHGTWKQWTFTPQGRRHH